MVLYLTGPSAVAYWRRRNPPGRRRTRAALPFGSASVDYGFKVSDLAALEEADLGWIPEPVHLLVPRAASRRRCGRARFHACSHPLPEGSFVRVSRDVLVSSPELTCVASAASSTFPLFVELLFEFCGRYRLPWGRAGEAVDMPPATSVSSLEAYCRKVQGVRGARDLRRALRYVCDNSLSPMETDIAEMMVFDPRMGGFGIEKPQLNPRFEVARRNRRALPQAAYLPDLYWPRAHLSVEYDSDKHHSEQRKLARDAIRRNGIEHLGTRVITLTWNQAGSYFEFERVALMVASALGKRYGVDWKRWEGKRFDLHRLLLRR